MKYHEFASSEYGMRLVKYDGKTTGYRITEAELEARFATYQAVIADHLSILNSSTLSDTLARCLSLFDNTVTVGLQYYPAHFLLGSEKGAGFRCLGLRELKKQLRCRERHQKRYNGPMPAILANTHAKTFSALVNALIRSGRKIQSLHTCGYHFCGLALQHIQLAESDYHSLLSLLEELRSLHMCIRLPKNTSPDQTTFDSLINILLTTAPTLEDLTFSQWIPNGEMSPTYFENISQKIQFSQLRELCLQSIEITVNTFKAFLRTAAPTLTKITLEAISLTDKLSSVPDPVPMTMASQVPSLSKETRQEIKQLWRLIFEHMANHLQLQVVLLHNLGYRGRYMGFHGRLSLSCGHMEWPFNASLMAACFDVDRSSVSLHTWITQLELRMSNSILRDLPGSNFGG
jgi:hypothetical protein